MPYKLRTRFAPTPSGPLHLGNAWSFVLTWLAARSQGGHIHLRIDDLDAARLRDDHVEDIFASLEWLGLDWDAGPRDAAEFRAAHSQRLRLDRYRSALDVLRAGGGVYACACTRSRARRDAAGNAAYPGTCRDRNLDADLPENSLRFRLPSDPVHARDAEGAFFELRPDRDPGDVVLRQKNGDPSYQLASVVDDEDLGVNFVVRGLDLLPSTGAQLRLAAALDYDTFANARFWHHPLILDDAGEKLSKSRGADSLQQLRARFTTPEPIYRFFAAALGRDPATVSTVRDLLPGFRTGVGEKPLRLSDFWRLVGA